MAFFNTGNGGENLARSAIPALKGIVVDEGLLHRVQPFACHREALDRGHFMASGHYREGHAGQHSLAVQQYRAGTALAVAATLLGTGQAHVIAYRREQSGAWVQPQSVELTVDCQRHFIHGVISRECCVVNAIWREMFRAASEEPRVLSPIVWTMQPFHYQRPESAEAAAR